VARRAVRREVSMSGPTLKPLSERFWVKVDKRGPDECWQWIGIRNEDGYGRPYLRAHRVSWQIANGRDPGSLFVCHSCDNPSCVNPNHLWLGTNTVNLRDMVAKGRHGNQRKTHCPSGHEYSPENTRHEKRGRRCLTCERSRGRRRLAA
jgi:hypothetical protein